MRPGEAIELREEGGQEGEKALVEDLGPGKLELVGGLYDVSTGRVTFLEP